MRSVRYLDGEEHRPVFDFVAELLAAAVGGDASSTALERSLSFRLKGASRARVNRPVRILDLASMARDTGQGED